MINVLTSPRRKCNIYGATTFILKDSILTSLVLVHAGYLFCNWHSLNTNYYGTTFSGMPRSFNSPYHSSPKRVKFELNHNHIKLCHKRVLQESINEKKNLPKPYPFYQFGVQSVYYTEFQILDSVRGKVSKDNRNHNLVAALVVYSHFIRLKHSAQ